MPDEPSAELEEWGPGNFAAGSDAWSGQPRRTPARRPTEAAAGFVPAVPFHSGGVNDYVELARLWIEWAKAEVAGGRFGDASDGDHVVAGTESLSGPAFYDNLEIPTGTILQTRGHPVFVRGVLSGDGTIFTGGADAAGAVGGAASATTSSWGKGGAGGAAGAPGNAGTSRTNSLGGAGGIGGNEGGGGSLGGAAGTVTAPTDAIGGTDVWRQLDLAATGRTLDGTVITGGAGGGGGGGVTGGGGGAGGDVLGLFVNVWNFEGTIDGRGGNGAAATASDDGGGAPGGGAPVLLVIRRGDAVDVESPTGVHTIAVAVAGSVYTTVVDVRAGTVGAGDGTGFAGSVGGVGRVHVVRG